MASKPPTARNPEATRQKLLQATTRLVLHRGFTATGIDQICAEAGVTKGAFFHHFKSKEDLGQAILANWAAHGTSIYAMAKADPAQSPLEQLHRLIEIMMGLAAGTAGPLACVVGMISQEMSCTNPSLRESCSTYLGDWTRMVRDLLVQAKSAQRPAIDFDADEVAWFLNSLWQGSMLVAKPTQTPDMVVRNLQHARAYIDSLFGLPQATASKAPAKP